MQLEEADRARLLRVERGKGLGNLIAQRRRVHAHGGERAPQQLLRDLSLAPKACERPHISAK